MAEIQVSIYVIDVHVYMTDGKR